MIEESRIFYNSESVKYSKKRYEGALLTYTQYLFRRRLGIFLDMLKHTVKEKKEISVFEIGCADGIILQTAADLFPREIKTLVGIDISEGMIAEARSKNSNPNMTFAMRGEEQVGVFDLIIELGVHVEKLEDELAYVKSKMTKDGYFIYSAAGKNSIHARLKLKDKAYAQEYLEYAEVDKKLTEQFEIVDSEVYGLFVPKLWAVPFLGKTLQPLFDGFFKFVPSLYHEKIYLLKNKA